MLGGWPDQLITPSGTRRPTAHVNPLPARKPSKRAKYGDAATANKERRLGRSPKPPVVRPCPKRATDYFEELIRSAQDQPAGGSEGAQPPPPQPPRQLQVLPHPPRAQPTAKAQEQQLLELPAYPQGRVAAPPLASGSSDSGGAHSDPDSDLEPRPVSVTRKGQLCSRDAAVPPRSPPRQPRPAPGVEPGPGGRQPGCDGAHPHPDPHSDPDPDRASSTVGASTSSAPAPAAEAAAAPGPGGGSSAGFRRRRKLFADSLDGPHPRTTAKIVARLAACRHWRRPLAHRLLPRYLPLFDQHAAAYFFKHVPNLQPRSALRPGAEGVGSTIGGSGRGGGGGGEAASFQVMVVAVCCSLLPKMASFGPRALACMAAGLGRMRIRHGPTLAAWEAHSVAKLGLMRPDQLVASLEGMAELRGGPMGHPAADTTANGGTAGVSEPGPPTLRRRVTSRGRPGWRRRGPRRAVGEEGGRERRRVVGPLGAAWREAAVAAAQCALPRMTVAEVGRLLRALAALGLAPPRTLLDAACVRLQTGLLEEAARLTAAGGSVDGAASTEMHIGAGDGAGDGEGAGVGAAEPLRGGSGGGRGRSADGIAGWPGGGGGVLLAPSLEPSLEPALEKAALLSIASALEEAAARRAAAPYSIGTVGATGGAVGIVAASEAEAAAAAAARRDGKPKGRGREAGQRRPAVAPPEPEPVCGGDVARVVRGLGALGHVPSREWLGWLLGAVEAVLRWQLGGAAPEQLGGAAPEQRRGRPPGSTGKGPRARRQWVAAAGGAGAEATAAAAASAPAGTKVGLTAGGAPPLPPPTTRFFGAEDLAELAAGLADLLPVRSVKPSTAAAAATSAAAAASLLSPVSTSPSAPTSKQSTDHVVEGGAPGRAAPPPVPAYWLDLLLEAALVDVRQRLDPRAAASAAAAAAAADPVAILTRGDVTKADAAAVAAAAGTATAAAAAAADAVPAASCLLSALLQLLPYYSPPRPWCAAAADVGLELVPYMPPAALLLWLRSFAAWGVPKPLPPAWHAAAAVHSRTHLHEYANEQLYELPGALVAAGARMPAPWAAQYVRQVAARLLARPGDEILYDKELPPSQPGSGLGGSRTAGSAGGPGGDRGGSGTASSKVGAADGGAAVDKAPTAAAHVALIDAAAALGSLPYIVPDLRYAGECERAALQALAQRFGLTPGPPLPRPPHGDREQLRAPQAPQAPPPPPSTPPGGAAAGAATATASSSMGPSAAGFDGGGAMAAGGKAAAVAGGMVGELGEPREAVAAFLAAAGWGGWEA